MGQEINQKSHDSAISNIIVLLTKEHHILEAQLITRREKESCLQREKISQKTKKPRKQKHNSNKRKTESPPPPPLIRLPKGGKGTKGKLIALYKAVLANINLKEIRGRNNYVDFLVTLLRTSEMSGCSCSY